MLPHSFKPGKKFGRLNQQTIWVKSVCGVTILVGMIASSTALGSHLDPSSSGPPQIQKRQQTQKLRPRTQKTPVSFSSSRTNRETPPPHPIPEVAGPNTHTTKPSAKSGWQFLLNGQPQAAMAAYRQAIRQNSESADAYLGLGISLKTLGKVDLAKKALVKAVALDPDLPPALVHLGYLYADGHFGQSDMKTARRLFQQASQLGDPFASIALLDMKSHPRF